ncbi:tumor necrosis factor receptor superfamily member 5-like isoform X2 [Phascolarctos cinereus]|uniref:Tumor necrosis factor receptor superfamily member 5-like isoform X2 n=1 Tax=Phascolarctos cinereus TaxID=38626 RepID=A0A6P5JB80_PHACI|nr:tumor necrosis factor receptor superfamily member 5-like isoform X2 [Phascolarctos cinereus]
MVVNRLRLTIFSIITTQLMPFKEALECMVGEYKVDGQCCPTCHPAFGLVTRRECSPISNTVCGCSPGYFCTNMKDDDCEMCVAHRVCTPGQYVKSRGTERNNTICEKCQAGTFSPNGTLGQCLPWTNCTAQGLFEEKPGTDTMDTLCSMQGNPPLGFIGTPIIIIIIIIIVTFVITVISIIMIFVRRKKNRERAYDIKGRAEASDPEKICDLLEADGSIINLPVQETQQQEESDVVSRIMSKS